MILNPRDRYLINKTRKEYENKIKEYEEKIKEYEEILKQEKIQTT